MREKGDLISVNHFLLRHFYKRKDAISASPACVIRDKRFFRLIASIVPLYAALNIFLLAFRHLVASKFMQARAY
jgi:hypothetical protein